MRDERTLMDVLKNDSVYPRLSDWEKLIIRRSQYELDAALLKLEQKDKELERLQEAMTKMLMGAGKDYKVTPIRGGSFENGND